MTEILKITKISLLAYGIVCLLYGVLAVFLFDMVVAMTGFNDPFQSRLFGGVLLVITIYTFLIVFKKDWEHVKLAYLVLYSLILSTIIMEGAVTVMLYSSLSAEAINMHIMDLIIMPILLILGIYSYMKQEG